MAEARFILEARIALGKPLIIGHLPQGYRRIIPILGGTFEGPDLKGEVLPFGADWNLLLPNGLMTMDTRYSLRTDADELISVENKGHRFLDPAIAKAIAEGTPVDLTGARSAGATRFETGSLRLAWMNESTFQPRDNRAENGISIRFYQPAWPADDYGTVG